MSRINFLGGRGSIPVCAQEFQEFGGNTTCVLLEGPKRTGIFDGRDETKIYGFFLAI